MMRPEVEALVRHGRLPAEDEAEEKIAEVERLLHAVRAPLTDVEAHALVGIFGPDDCYGLSWTLVHLIETAPGALRAEYDARGGDPWVGVLNARVAAARGDAD